MAENNQKIENPLEPKPKKKFGLSLIFLTVVLVLLVGCGVYFILSNQHKVGETNQEQAQGEEPTGDNLSDNSNNSSTNTDVPVTSADIDSEIDQLDQMINSLDADNDLGESNLSDSEVGI